MSLRSHPLPPSPGLECAKLTDYLCKEEVVKALKTSLASMQYGNEDFLADLVAEACSESCDTCDTMMVEAWDP